MPLIAFVDSQVLKELEKIPNSGTISKFPEHTFVKNCISCGITINDLEKLSFVSAFKIILSSINVNENKIRYATQKDWDRLAM